MARRPKNFPVVRWYTAQWESTCTKCNERILEGTRQLWVKRTKDTKRGEAENYHEACAPSDMAVKGVARTAAIPADLEAQVAAQLDADAQAKSVTVANVQPTDPSQPPPPSSPPIPPQTSAVPERCRRFETVRGTMEQCVRDEHADAIPHAFNRRPQAAAGEAFESLDELAGYTDVAAGDLVDDILTACGDLPATPDGRIDRIRELVRDLGRLVDDSEKS